jgi:hypothetical protein
MTHLLQHWIPITRGTTNTAAAASSTTNCTSKPSHEASGTSSFSCRRKKRLTGVFEGYCPPHYKDMREALEALVKRKFGQGGVYNLETPGAWKDSAKVRSSAKPFTDQIKECVY